MYGSLKHSRLPIGALSIPYFVHIIESQSSNDILEDISEGLVLTKSLSLANISSTYNLATNRTTFETSLGKRLNDFALENKGLPILHFSAHGNNNGIALTCGEFLGWDELRELLVPINAAMQGSLIVCFSSCSGFTGCKMAMTNDGKLPFFGLVGHPGKPDWSDAAVGYIAFYHHLFKGKTMHESLEAMKTASGDTGFQVATGEEARRTWIEYIEPKRESILAQLLSRMSD